MLHNNVKLDRGVVQPPPQVLHFVDGLVEGDVPVTIHQHPSERRRDAARVDGDSEGAQVSHVASYAVAFI